MAGQFEFIKDHWIVIEAVDGNDPEPDGNDKESSSKDKIKDKEKDKKKDKINRKRHRSSDDSDDEISKKRKRKKKSSKKRSKRRRDSSSSDDSDSSDSSDHRRKRKRKSNKKSKSKKSHKNKKDRDKDKEKDREREKDKLKEKEKEKDREKEKLREKDKDKEKEKEKVKEKEKEPEKEKEKDKEKPKEKEKEEKKEKEKESDKDKDRSKRRRESSVPKASTSSSKKDLTNSDDNPYSLIKYTITKPSIQYSVNPRSVTDISTFLYESLKSSGKSSTNLATSSSSSVKKSSYSKSSSSNKESSKSTIKSLSSIKLEKESDSRHNEHGDLSPSERRTLEKVKKQQQKELEKAVEKKLKSELKTDAIATYYSSKNRNSSSESTKNKIKDEPKSDDKSIESTATETKESTEQKESHPSIESTDKETLKSVDKSSSDESNKKMTAKELLDRVRAKKGSSETASQSKLLMTKLPIIGKIRKSNKKDSSKNEDHNLAAKEKQDQPVYSIGTDYHWYYRYYMTAYGLEPHMASYYAQYHISTSGEYQTPDLSTWFQHQGYNVLSVPTADQQLQMQINLHMQSQALQSQIQSQVQQLQQSTAPIGDSVDLKTEETKSEIQGEEVQVAPEVINDENIKMEIDQSTDQVETKEKIKEEIKESEGSSVVPDNVGTSEESLKEETVPKVPETQDQVETQAMDVEPSDTLINSEITTNEPAETFGKNETPQETGNKDSSEIIQVIVPRIPLSANEMLVVSGKSPEPEYYQEDGDNDGSPPPSPPPPPPPPMRPTMTHLKTEKDICLPNGQKLPAGTEQIIIHPYPSSHPFSNYFNADAFAKGLAETHHQSQENVSNLKSSSTLSHVIS